MSLHALEEGLQAAGVALPQEQVARLGTYAELLWTANHDANLVGYESWEVLLREGVLDSVLLWRQAQPKGRVIDVGSGGGLPGVVWAILGEEVELTLLDATRRKVDFLDRVRAEMGLEYTTLWGRAEEIGRGTLREAFDGAVARALAPPVAATELTVPLVRLGGVVWLARGPEEDPDGAAVRAGLLGAELIRDQGYALPEGGERRLWVLRKRSATPDRYPRPFAQIRRDSWR